MCGLVPLCNTLPPPGYRTRCMYPGERHTDWISSIVSALVSQLDLNDVDSLSRTCRGVHDSLLQNRPVLLRSTIRCSNDDVPVDPESTLRYRARAGNWYYMEDTSRCAQYNGKSGSCARDMVASCRKCATIICRVSLDFPQLCFVRVCPGLTALRAELCDKAASPSGSSRQTPPSLPRLSKVSHRLRCNTTSEPRPSAQL